MLQTNCQIRGGITVPPKIRTRIRILGVGFLEIGFLILWSLRCKVRILKKTFKINIRKKFIFCVAQIAFCEFPAQRFPSILIQKFFSDIYCKCFFRNANFAVGWIRVDHKIRSPISRNPTPKIRIRVRTSGEPKMNIYCVAKSVFLCIFSKYKNNF